MFDIPEGDSQKCVSRRVLIETETKSGDSITRNHQIYVLPLGNPFAPFEQQYRWALLRAHLRLRCVGSRFISNMN